MSAPLVETVTCNTPVARPATPTGVESPHPAAANTNPHAMMTRAHRPAVVTLFIPPPCSRIAALLARAYVSLASQYEAKASGHRHGRVTPAVTGPSLVGASMIRFRMLGGVSLTAADGHEVRSLLAQPRRLALLAYLAAATPRDFQRRDSLVALFWPELDQKHARAALREALHVLRGAVGQGIVTRRGDEEIGLDSDLFWNDVAAFDRAVAAAEWGEALELYRATCWKGSSSRRRLSSNAGWRPSAPDSRTRPVAARTPSSTAARQVVTSRRPRAGLDALRGSRPSMRSWCATGSHCSTGWATVPGPYRCTTNSRHGWLRNTRCSPPPKRRR